MAPLRPAAAALVLVVGLTLAVASPPASAGDQTVAYERFARLARAASTPDFPVSSHPAVYRVFLKKFGRAGGRNWARHVLDHRERFAWMINDALDERGLPRQLAAIPFIEAGYRNLGSDDPLDQVPYELGPVGRGLWMFIRPTALAYGLRVDSEVDERVHAEKATDAALTYLAELHHNWKDWPLAFAAYHRGGAVVRRAIRDTGTRDAFELIEAGAINTYPARIMAAVVVMHDPSLVNWRGIDGPGSSWPSLQVEPEARERTAEAR